jgi:lipopolysaccharide/colanic/teichoic acid biosynthesis glycosyltransferase
MNTNPQWLNRPNQQTSGLQINIAYLGVDFQELFLAEMPSSYAISWHQEINQLQNTLRQQSILQLPDVLVLEVDRQGQCFEFIETIKKDLHLQGLLVVLLSKYDNAEWKAKAVALKVHDYYLYPFSVNSLHERIKLLLKLRILTPQKAEPHLPHHSKEFVYKMPFSKRLFDVVVSATILVLLSPLFLIVGLLILLESKGPVIYRSKRVGTGYKVFDFYKFRSMQVDADTKLADFEKINLYGNGQNNLNKAVFFKVANDPRITKVGQFIRNTSIDELPQLFNILIGNMSFVGNRPLPLYEAELLTSNEWSMRFLGPAGLTGLWQITKRGKRTVSEQERKELDNYYARSCSFWLDLKIILKTFPALIQQEQV